VRCTSCKSSWHATPSADAQRAPLELVLDDEEGAVARAPYDLDVEPGGADAAADLPGRGAAEAVPRAGDASERLRKAAAAARLGPAGGGVRGGAGRGGGVPGATWCGRGRRRRACYATVGLPVNATGLVIEDARRRPGLRRGRSRRWWCAGDPERARSVGARRRR
jgi:hypothetical protein